MARRRLHYLNRERHKKSLGGRAPVSRRLMKRTVSFRILRIIAFTYQHHAMGDIGTYK
jgi:hypothetical protein